MIRNGVAKGKLLQCYRRGHRDFSSVIEKEAQPSGEMMKIGENLIGFVYKAAVGGVGFALGGLSTTSEAPKVVEAEERIVKLGEEFEIIAEDERLEKMKKMKWKLMKEQV